MASRYLEVTDLHGWYGESHVLHGINFHVDEGEVVTLLGRNGAGRTSTLRAILGLIGSRKGSVKVHGVETIAMPTHRIIPASALRPGLATIIVSLPDRTIRSCVFMVQVWPHGVVQVAFTSGDMITLSTRTMVGRIDHAAGDRARLSSGRGR